MSQISINCKCVINLRNCLPSCSILQPKYNFFIIKLMIKAPLTYHDPLDIFDHLKNEYGNLSMIIKGNFAILNFENVVAKMLILQNPKKIIKGLPITFKPFEHDEPDQLQTKRKADPNRMDLEESRTSIEDLLILGDTISFPNVNQKIKKIGEAYQKKIKFIKSNYLNEEICNQKITQFNTFLEKHIKNNQFTFLSPFKHLVQTIQKFSLNSQQDPVDLEQTFIPSQRPPNFIFKAPVFNLRPTFSQGFSYSSSDVGSVKRLCLLNQDNFIATLKLKQQNYEMGQLRIFHKEKIDSQFSLDIEQVPYSLMMHQNFILTGDYQGFIHFIDVNNKNMCEYSNKLNAGLIVQMQKFQKKRTLPSMITLLSGLRNDYRIKIFQIQNEQINSDVSSLTFHPKEQILCEGITMTMQVLQEGKFAYGCGRNTYICPSFDKSERDIIIHDHNVMKIRLKSSQQLIEVTQKKIFNLDLRATKIKNQIFQLDHPMRQFSNFEILSENYGFYGGKKGEVGLIDFRKPNTLVWCPTQNLHQGKISDILRMGNDVITADSNGNILGWKNKQFQ